MHGYQITFFTVQDRKHGHQQLSDWLMAEAKHLGGGATLIPAAEGFGRGHKKHSAGFVDLADQPIKVEMVLSQEEAAFLFDRLREENIDVFYTKLPIEFGVTSDL
jgi:uncharacterized protein